MSLLTRRLALLAIPLLALASCGPQGTTKKVISKVDVDNGGQTVKVGGTTKVTLTATLADGTKEDISLLATWTTRLNDGTTNSADAFATVDGSGMVKGVAPGNFFVLAKLEFGPGFGGYEAYSNNFEIGFSTVP